MNQSVFVYTQGCTQGQVKVAQATDHLPSLADLHMLPINAQLVTFASISISFYYAIT